MNAVHLWKCDCGKRFKVITETHLEQPNTQSSVTCPDCQKHVSIDGKLLNIQVQGKNEESWKTLLT